MSSDAELLDAFLDRRSETAFRALVERHLPLVYAAARRQTGDAQLAEDVAQGVFTLLARKASALRGHPTLTGWLYTSTYHVAAKARRAEQRRFHREKDALTTMMHETAPDSPEIDFVLLRPVIDAALIELKEDDRLAVLLRFFENRSYAEIGAQLDVTENTARMRVERALDRLQIALRKRGVSSTAGALGATLAAQATCTVPAGLAAGISTTALAASAAGGLLFLMSTAFVKNAAIAVVAIAAAGGLFLQHQEIAELRGENALLADAADRAQKQKAVQKLAVSASSLETNTELARLRAEVEQLKRTPANSWQQRVDLLKEMLQQMPEQNIPEIALASDDDWLEAAKHPLETPDDYRRALSSLRNLSVGKATHLMQPAIKAYQNDHGGQFPTTVSDLQPYVGSKLTDAIWQRYVITGVDTVPNLHMGGNFIITQASVVDPTYDNQYVIGSNGMGSGSYGINTMMVMEKAYKQDNGAYPTDLTLLRPYAVTPQQQAALAAQLEREAGKSSSKDK